MFNSFSSQHNNYNAGVKIDSSFYNMSKPSSQSFPISSQFLRSTRNSQLPVTQPSYQYYQPKSKIGQLNQRIETQKRRRDSFRNKMGSSNRRHGYMSDSQRSHSTIKSYSRKESQINYKQEKQPTHRWQYSSKNEFPTTQSVLGPQPIWQSTSQQAGLPLNQAASVIPKWAPTMSPPRSPEVITSDVNASSRYNNINQIKQYTNTPQYYNNPASQEQQMARYPSFRKPNSKQQPIYPHYNEQEIFFDADSHRRDHEEPFSGIPKTFIEYNVTPEFAQKKNPPILITDMQSSQIQPPIIFNSVNLSNSLSDVLDKSGITAKYLGIGIIGFVFLLMIYEIIR